MREIRLTRGFVTTIDCECFEKVSQYKWCALVVKSKQYAVSRINNKFIYMHKFIIGAPPNRFVEIDHINGNSLDNRRSNLRWANRHQNSANALKTKKKCSSKFKGVWWHKQNKKWAAEITVHGQKIRLKTYHLESDAAKAYNDAALKYFGKFAKLNSFKDEAK